MSSIPSIELSPLEWQTLRPEHFWHATNGEAAPQRTEVHLKYDHDALQIRFVCADNPFWAQNTYLAHNTDLWNQEVFEVFLAAGDATPTRYLEVEINPNNALFVGWISNPTLEAPDQLQFVAYEQAGIGHEVAATAHTWSGTLHIPWALLGGIQDTYRLNFYRVTSLEPHTEHDWAGTPTDCSYTCWSSTHSGEVPRFHRPAYFGVLRLVR
jgi:hypothetical protein